MFGGSLQVSAGRKEASAPSEPRATPAVKVKVKAKQSKPQPKASSVHSDKSSTILIGARYTSSYNDRILYHTKLPEMLWRGCFFTLSRHGDALIAKRLLVQPSVFWLACFLVVFTPPAATLFIDQRQSPSNSDNNSLRGRDDVCRTIGIPSVYRKSISRIPSLPCSTVRCLHRDEGDAVGFAK